MRRGALALALLSLATVVGVIAPRPADAGTAGPAARVAPTALTNTGTGFPSVNGNWAATGPFAVTVGPNDGAHTIYRPTDLGQNGVRHPVILWGNGTGATPGIYDGLLRHLASHGFVVAAANTTQSGSGQEMLSGATFLANENNRPGSVYYQKIDTSRIGATGHSQGGGGAIAAGADPRVDTIVPIEPGPQGTISALHGPMFILAGQFDTIVWPWLLVIPRYNAATQIPAVLGELAGASHFTPVPDGGGFRGNITAWFRFWLMDDEQARSVFFGPTSSCRICNDSAWSDVRRNARALAIPG
jgi:hypothetical protein